MSNSVLLESAYILHARAYRDTSLLLELFTQEHGRVSAVARGAKGARSRFKGLLQPFVPLVVSWSGKGELMTLLAAEANGIAHSLTGDALVCGIYLNELLMRLLHRYDAHSILYQNYRQALCGLQEKTSQVSGVPAKKLAGTPSLLNRSAKAELSLAVRGENPFSPLTTPHRRCAAGTAEQVVLREFEKQLLIELGYALELDREAQTGMMVSPEQFYYFDPSHGLFACKAPTSQSTIQQVFSGKSLLALHTGDLLEENYLRDAKRLLRLALGHLLGGKPIRSRELLL